MPPSSAHVPRLAYAVLNVPLQVRETYPDEVVCAVSAGLEWRLRQWRRQGREGEAEKEERGWGERQESKKRRQEIVGLLGQPKTLTLPG